MSGFVHLHLHSEYSLLDGVCRMSDIPKAAKAAGQTAVALTDHGNMFGAVSFYKACVSEGVKPIIGCEVYSANGSRFDRPARGERAYYHLILLCKNEAGYKNLCYLLSKSYTEGFYIRPRIDDELLFEHSDGLICLSACLAGYIPQHILAGDTDAAKAYALKLNSVFGEGNFYLEIQDHGLEEDGQVNRAFAEISRETGIPLAATNDVHYISKSDASTQKLLMAIQTGKTLDDVKEIAFPTDEFYFKSEREMEELFSNYGDAVSNTQVIADKCQLSFDFSGYVFPKVELEGGVDPKDQLKRLAYEGLEKRISSGEIVFERHSRDAYVERTEYELSVICSMGFAEYYLIVCDFVNYAKNAGIAVGPGRGSGAASLVAYLTGITDVDPIEYELLFETFLNPERVSMPDFDIDFHHIRRNEVFDYVRRKYGDDKVSKIIAFDTLAARAAVRDAGRALDVSYAETDAVAKLIPRTEPGDQSKKMTLKRALEFPEIKREYDSSEKTKKLIDAAMRIEGMPKNISMHAAGVVISDKPVYEYAPLAVSGDTVVTQFDMDSISALGLLKFDFLGLRELTTIETCVSMIREREPDFDLKKIPLDDKETYALLSRGDTVGIFQLESAGMRRMLSRLKPRNMNDVMLALALYRPGASGFINQLIENRTSGKRSDYPIKALSEILDETYGCIVYSEQVIRILRVIAGYSFGKADVVSRAIKKKKHDVISAERDAFISGATAKGADRRDAEKLFEDIEGFSKYGFKKSHAAAYGIISYRTAYLKAHYTALYYAALLSTELADTNSVVKYINDAVHFGIRIKVPDINESDIGFTVSADGRNIRYGLLALKNVGSNFAKQIVDERKKKPFSGFADFLTRMSEYDANRKQIESLIKAGAFDSLGVNRSVLLASYDEMLDLILRKRRTDMDGQMDMFSSADGDNVEFNFKEMPEFDLKTKLLYEKEVSGMYMSAHPLDKYDAVLCRIGPSEICDVLDPDRDRTSFPDRGTVTFAGIVTSVNVKNTKGGRTAFVTIEDKTGSIEAIVFSSVYSECAELLINDNAIVINGELSFRENEAPKILAKKVSLLNDKLAADHPRQAAAPERKLYVRVPSRDSAEWKRADAVISIFSGQTAVVVYENDKKKYCSLSNKGVTADDFVLGELREILG
ncbi:MAG: DNA polymerase III subunit alpha, partial [Clostridia bacterium]|nr:DNA polymerase III subunit alpha [Clostridia bacterium]